MDMQTNAHALNSEHDDDGASSRRQVMSAATLVETVAETTINNIMDLIKFKV